MARVRGFDACPNKVTMGEVMNIFCLLGMTDHRYDGILSRYAAGDTEVVIADLSQLESLMMGEDERKKILGLPHTAAPISAAAQCMSAVPKKPPATAPKVPQDKPPPSVYPPGEGILWDTI